MHFSAAAADLAEGFFRQRLQHIKGPMARKPLVLEPWQRDRIIRPLFGTLDEQGNRQYRTVFLFVARKNGKSTLAAGTALASFFLDQEEGAEIYCAAADREQARLVFEVAKEQVLRDERLSALSEVLSRSISMPRLASTFHVISSDAGTKHGFNSHCVIIDELHAHRSSELYDVLVTSTGSRRQPIVFIITTAGFDRNSVCYREYEYACKVRDGIVDDPRYLPVIYECPEDDTWDDPATWAAANPNLGVSIDQQYLEMMAVQARENLAKQNTFRQLHLNQWTSQQTRWLDMGHWMACSERIDWEALHGRVCYGGLDLSATKDYTAFALAFELGDGRVAFWPHMLIPEETAAQRARRERVPIQEWIRAGHLTVTPGNVVDYDAMRRTINELGRRYKILEIGYDPWNSSQIAQQLAGDGFEMVEVRQGFASLSEPSKRFDTLVQSERIVHNRHPVLQWMASVVSVKMDPAGNIKPMKTNENDKIDGIVASIMALSRLMASEQAPSVYESEGWEM